MEQRSYEKLISSRNNNLDLIKLCACIAVVGLHTLQKDLSVFNATIYYLCGFAVPAFFMASGYILLNRNGITLKYCIKKIFRIMKIVICWSTIIVLLESIAYLLTNRIESISILSLPQLVVLSLLQKGELWHFWYFGALIIIYGCLPLLYKVKKREVIWLILVIIGCGIQIISYFYGKPLQSFIIQTFRVWTWFQYFILGGIIGKKIKKSSLKNSSVNLFRVGLLFATVWIIFYQNLVGRYLLYNLYAEYFYDSIFTIIWLIMIFVFMLKLNFSQKINTIIEKTSPIMMGVYILHPLIMNVFLHFVSIDTVLMSLVYFIVIMLISAISALILSKIPILKNLIKM